MTDNLKHEMERLKTIAVTIPDYEAHDRWISIIEALEMSLKTFEWIADKNTDTLGAHSMRAQASAYGAIKRIEQLLCPKESFTIERNENI